MLNAQETDVILTSVDGLNKVTNHYGKVIPDKRGRGLRGKIRQGAYEEGSSCLTLEVGRFQTKTAICNTWV